MINDEQDDPISLSLNAIQVLEYRYLLRDKNGEFLETPAGMFRRVARHIASIENDKEKYEQDFYEMMTHLEFLPNSPVLFNAGTPVGQMSACFVLPVRDDMESISDAWKNMALIHKSGGGTGFSFSDLRPKGSVIKTSGGEASGAVSFMSVFDKITDVIKQGGRRRGANMGLLRYDHPEIEEFVQCKRDKKSFRNFNISVAVDNFFMEHLDVDSIVILMHPEQQYHPIIGNQYLFDLITKCAWETGDPGIIFMERINEQTKLRYGEIVSTNPCGEVPMLEHESCVLGSINLSKFVEDGEIDWTRMGEVIDLAVRFLDNVIDLNHYPLPEIEEMTKATRKLGLGVMGWAEMLIKLRIQYDSPEAIEMARQVMQFINDRAVIASVQLAEERGVFPLFEYFEDQNERRRNATVTTIAPTGSIGIIAGVTGGIEPIFSKNLTRRLGDGTLLTERHSLLETYPEELFRTSHEIAPEWHVRMQAAFQEHTENAVSKTVNLKSDATVEDVKTIYRLAYELGCKGITIFRDGCLSDQVLYNGDSCKLGGCD